MGEAISPPIPFWGRATFLLQKTERAAVRKRRHQGKRGSKQDLNQPGGKIIHWLAREWKRRGRIRHLRANPAGIWAKASKKKRGDREVESTINAWGLLLSGLKATDRNRRVSVPLSPIFSLFLAPSGKLSHKLQDLLTEDE
jgi:hypothetical protein